MDPKQALREKFAKMGVKNAGNIVQETVVGPVVKNVDRYKKLMDIKSGAARGRVKELVHANHVDGAPEIAGTTMGGPSTFVPIPKPKVRPRPGESSEKKTVVPVAEFKAPAAKEEGGSLNMIASMFNERRGQTQYVPAGTAGGTQKGSNINLDQVMNQSPTFNPELARERMRQKAAASSKSQDNQYLQYSLAANSNIEEDMDQHVATEEYVEHGNKGSNVDMNAMQRMMESIARGVVESMAEQKMKQVLDHYLSDKTTIPNSQKNDSKNMNLEYYGKNKATSNIIVKKDNKYFELVPVKITSER